MVKVCVILLALSVACLNARKETVTYLLTNGARISYGRCDHPVPPLIQVILKVDYYLRELLQVSCGLGSGQRLLGDCVHIAG